jgi:GMP synthase-like glutamine amidotransferase
MKIGILQADSVMDQFQPRHGNYPGMFEEILGRAAADLGLEIEFETYDVEHGEYPSKPDVCDGYVITGSKKSVYDEDPWISELGEYLRDLHRCQAKVVGICFGHQLVAEYLGGKTEGAKAGWGVGIHTSEVRSAARFMDPPLSEYSLIVSHRDQVVAMPEEARLLATSDFCPNSMFTIGDHILAMQGHPEFKREYSSDLMSFREDILGPEKYAAGVTSLEQSLSSDDVSRWIIRFLVAA